MGVDFVGPHTWEMIYGDNAIMRVADGRPQFPQPRLSSQHFKQRVNDLFFAPSGDDKAADKLWELVDQATKQGHGTMIVIADDAKAEAERMAAQAIPVLPGELPTCGVLPVTAIDGAVLLDQTGACYAVGVILDGTVREGEGDSSRGARYNSAVRYVNGAPAGERRLAVIISEDGMVNLVPREMTRPPIVG